MGPKLNFEKVGSAIPNFVILITLKEENCTFFTQKTYLLNWPSGVLWTLFDEKYRTDFILENIFQNLDNKQDTFINWPL